MMSDFASRLKEVREELGFSVPDFAASIAYDVSNYRKVEKGRFLLPPDKQEVLCTLHSINLNWLLAGLGSHFLGPITKYSVVEKEEIILKEDPAEYESADAKVTVSEEDSTPAAQQSKLEVAKRALREIELFYREPGEPNVYDLETPAAAGRAITLLEEDKIRIKPNLYIPGLGPGIHVRMPVSGSSMSPTIRNEDRIVGTWIADRSMPLKEGRAYIIIDMDDDVVVKRVFFETGKYLRLVSDNNTVAPYPMPTDNVRGAFLVRQIHRSDIDPEESEILTEFRRIRSEWATFQALYSSKLNEL